MGFCCVGRNYRSVSFVNYLILFEMLGSFVGGSYILGSWVRVKIAIIKIWDLKYRGSYMGGSCVGGSYVGGSCVETTLDLVSRGSTVAFPLPLLFSDFDGQVHVPKSTV